VYKLGPGSRSPGAADILKYHVADGPGSIYDTKVSYIMIWTKVFM